MRRAKSTMQFFIKQFLFLFLLFPFSVIAQEKFTVSGFIYEAGSRETMPGAVVFTSDLKNGTVTNGFGFYSITLPAGDVELVFQLVGYSEQIHTLKLTADIKFDVFLESHAELQEVVVSAEKQRKISEETRMSTIEIPIDQIKKIPALLGEKDVLKVLQLMPGVQKGSEGNSGFYVRGGGPDQNLIILDDATVYNANHLFGFFSIFNGDALKSVELTKGGFPARYGGRLSSVLEMRMKDGNKEKITGEAGIGLISSRLTLEGPIVKGKSSFLVSGRRTYIDALVYPFLPSDSKGGYYFYDLNAKYNHVFDDANRLYVSGYFGKDKFYFNPQSQYSEQKGRFLWGNATGTVRWNHIFSDKVFSNTSVIFTQYKFGIGYEEKYQITDEYFKLNFNSGIQDWSGKFDLDFQPNPNHYIKTGAMITYHTFTPNATVINSSFAPDNERDVKKIFALESGVFVEDDWSITEKLKVNLGLRASLYNQHKRTYLRPEPRFSGRYMLAKDFSVKASYAMMNQYIHLLSNTGIGLPTDLWVPATQRVKPQQSQQWAIGLAKDLPKQNLMVSVEGYYKTMTDIITYKEGSSFLDAGFDEDVEVADWQTKVTSGKGWSYGAELLIQRKTGKLTGWIGYTLSWTQFQFDEINFGKKYFARYDRRHDLSLVGIYEIKENITLSATWVYGTGQAVTLPLAAYAINAHTPQFNQMISSLNGITGIGTQAQDYGEKNSFRMAPYHRLDIAAQFRKKLKRSERTIEVGVYNAYNRYNPFFYYTTTDINNNAKLMQVSLFPLLPSISWNYKF
jgi:outer membrane receptor for ferrienterochelin and colicin